MVNIGDFEGFVFGVYLRVVGERQGRKASQNCSSTKPIFASPSFQTEHQAKQRRLGFFLYHSFENAPTAPFWLDAVKQWAVGMTIWGQHAVICHWSFELHIALGNLDRFSNEWYKKKCKHLSLWGENWLNWRVVGERQGRKASQSRSSAKPIFTPQAEMFRILLVPFIRKSVQITKC